MSEIGQPDNDESDGKPQRNQTSVGKKSDSDKRGRKPEVPFGYEALLTDAQRHVLDAHRSKGWSLHFVRRPLFLQPTVVVVEPSSGKAWQIQDDGSLTPFNELRQGR